MVNTAAVRNGGDDCLRLVAITGEDGKVVRFEAKPYNHPAN
jgi:hypothetical protein